MTKLAAIFTTALVVGFLGALMPGPLLTVIISYSGINFLRGKER
jgi:threonine/homoserine/homoserine lactone efflux protein